MKEVVDENRKTSASNASPFPLLNEPFFCFGRRQHQPPPLIDRRTIKKSTNFMTTLYFIFFTLSSCFYHPALSFKFLRVLMASLFNFFRFLFTMIFVLFRSSHSHFLSPSICFPIYQVLLLESSLIFLLTFQNPPSILRAHLTISVRHDF